MKNISIVGAGSWGTSLAISLAKNEHKVSIWSCFEDEVNLLNTEREHIHKLPGVKIPHNVEITSDLELSINRKDAVVLVTPSSTIRKISKDISKFIDKDKLVICCSKGIEESTGKRLSEVILEEIPQCRVAVLSGPSHAEEVAKDIPTTVVAVSENIKIAKDVQDIFMSQMFRVYTNTDVVGAEIGGAVKNVIALCAGISDGLGFGDNTKAALMTRGMAEITRLGISLGANPETFFGLTGIGDLIVTCTSMHSRNRRAGILIGQGKSLDQALAEVKMVVEGVTTTKGTYYLARKQDISMPIIEQAYEILFNGKDARQAVIDLMTRDKKSELG